MEGKYLPEIKSPADVKKIPEQECFFIPAPGSLSSCNLPGLRSTLSEHVFDGSKRMNPVSSAGRKRILMEVHGS